MQILWYFFGVITDLLRTYYGVIYIFVGWVAWVPAWLVCVGFVCWKRSSRNPSLVGGILRLGFWLWLVCVGLCDGRGQSQKPNPRGSICGWSFFLWLLGWLRVMEEVKEKSPSQRVGLTKSSKVTKIPIALMVHWEFKRLP